MQVSGQRAVSWLRGDCRTMAATLPTGLTGPVQVALARTVEQIPRASALPGGCRFEPKWDGRLIVTSDQGGTNLWSRRGTDLSTTFPEITAACVDQLAPGTVLDGEVVAWSSGRLDFGALQTRMGHSPRSAAAHAASHPASRTPRSTSWPAQVGMCAVGRSTSAGASWNRSPLSGARH
jgi:ATP-dependent DNA ligase